MNELGFFYGLLYHTLYRFFFCHKRLLFFSPSLKVEFVFSLSVENLNFSYRKKPHLLSQVSFSVREGQCLLLEGANGTGKTTLFRLLAGLQAFDSGKILLHESDSRFQNFSCDYLQAESGGLFLKLSAFENMQFWARFSGVPLTKNIFFQLASQWGFRHSYLLEKLPVGRFSTGMKKKLALMRVFLGESRVLLLDEPLSGLDKMSCSLFFKEVLNQKEKGKIILMTSHQNSEAQESLFDQRYSLSSSLGEAR